MKAMGLQPQRLPTGAKSYVAPGEGALRRWIRTEVVRESPVFREKPTLERRLAGGNLQLGQPDTNRCSRAEKPATMRPANSPDSRHSESRCRRVAL
jgi:hypothetical protein